MCACVDLDMARVSVGMSPMHMMLSSYGNVHVTITYGYYGMKVGIEIMGACELVAACNFHGIPCMSMQSPGSHMPGIMHCMASSTSPAQPCSHAAMVVHCHSTRFQVECCCASCRTWAMHVASLSHPSPAMVQPHSQHSD